ILSPLYTHAHGNGPPPVWFMRQAGRYLPEYRAVRGKMAGFLDLCFSVEQATAVTLQPLQRFSALDAAIIFSDILLIPMALGRKLWFVDGEGPRLEPLSTNPQAWGMHRRDFAEILTPTCQAIAKVGKEIRPNQSIIGFSGAPFTLACYIIDGCGGEFPRTQQWCAEQRDLYLALSESLEEAIGDYLLQQIRHGADTVKIFDSWAGLVANKDVEDFLVNPMKRIVARIKEHYPHICVIGFPRGLDSSILLNYARVSCLDVLALGHDISPKWAAENLAGKLCLQGNLSPQTLLHGGEDLLRETDEILQALQETPFIFNLGHGIDKNTPLAHVETLIARIKRGG
ncbi:MAG: uroporphyrinogen decarboxylase, partial [Pseudomonadota bacterium]